MTFTEKTREFWLNHITETFYAEKADAEMATLGFPKITHVIEYTGYESLIKENVKLKTRLSDMMLVLQKHNLVHIPIGYCEACLVVKKATEILSNEWLAETFKLLGDK